MPMRMRMQLTPALLVLCVGTICAVDVPGLPVTPAPATDGDIWATWTNDGFGGDLGPSTDDWRTNAVDLGFRIGTADNTWRVAVNHSILSTKNPDDLPPNYTEPDPFAGRNAEAKRIDESSIGIGHDLPLPALGPYAGPRITPMVGLRFSGDIAGAQLQNATHSVLGDSPLDVPYERRDLRVWPYAGLDATWLVGPGARADAPIPFGIELAAGGTVTTAGEAQGELGARALILGSDGVAWVGARREFRNGATTSGTAQAVARHERGLWLEFGVRTGGFTFASSGDWRTRAVLGRVSWTWRRDPPRAALASSTAGISVEVGTPIYRKSPNGRTKFERSGLDYQLRWQPAAWRAADALTRRLAFTARYAFGDQPVPYIYDMESKYREGVIGSELAAFAQSGPGLHADPFVAAGLGYRRNDVRAINPAPSALAQGRSAYEAATLHAGAGVRVRWQPTTGTSYGASLLSEETLPFAKHTVSDAFRTKTGIDNADDTGQITSSFAVIVRFGGGISW